MILLSPEALKVRENRLLHKLKETVQSLSKVGTSKSRGFKMIPQGLKVKSPRSLKQQPLSHPDKEHRRPYLGDYTVTWKSSASSHLGTLSEILNNLTLRSIVKRSIS